MSHTLPDYTTKYKMAKIFGNIDDAELAARLGSIDTFDRRGNIIWMDDFEHGLEKWELSGNGAGNDSYISIDHVLTKSSSLKLILGSDSLRMYTATTYHHLPVLGRIGFEIAFKIDTEFDYAEINESIIVNSARIRPRIKVDYTNSKIQLYDGAGNWQDVITGISFATEKSFFHRLKFVIDYTTKKYVRLLFDNQSKDISAHSCNEDVSAVTDRFIVQTQWFGDVGENPEVYIDNVILTQNEF